MGGNGIFISLWRNDLQVSKRSLQVASFKLEILKGFQAYGNPNA
jgi:hypothetical protein